MLFCIKNIVINTGDAGIFNFNSYYRFLKNVCEMINLNNFYSCLKQTTARAVINKKFKFTCDYVSLLVFKKFNTILNLIRSGYPLNYQRNMVKTVNSYVHDNINMLSLTKELIHQFYKLALVKFLIILGFYFQKELSCITSIDLDGR